MDAACATGPARECKAAFSAEPVILKDGKLAVLPAPLLRRHESIDVSDALDTMVSPVGAVRVGVAHGSVKNRLPERSEATNEIADDRVQRARLDYLALGDWHGFCRLPTARITPGRPSLTASKTPIAVQAAKCSSSR